MRFSALPYLLWLVCLSGAALGGCALFGGDDGPDRPYGLDPEAICTNSVSGEWTLLGLKEETVSSILVHPENPQVLFAGTGFDFSAGRDGKIFRSVDCGETWELVYEGGSYRGLLLHPKDPYTLYGWHHRPTGGLIRSTDGGDNWEVWSEGMQTSGTSLTSAVLIHPQHPDTMYAGRGGIMGGSIYRSSDGGEHWEDIKDNWVHPNSSASIYDIAVDPTYSGWIYEVNANRTFNRSTDGGKSWQTLLNHEKPLTLIAINPENPNYIATATGQSILLVSEDRGETWREEEVLEPDVLLRDLRFIRNQLYIALEGGIVATNDFKNYSWLNKGIELGVSEQGHTLTIPRTIVADPHEENMYLGHPRVSESLVEGGFGGIFVRKVE